MAAMTRSAAATQARQEHQITLTYLFLGTNWSCSCGKGSASRLVPPSRPQALAYAERHLDAEAAKILREANRG